VDETTHEYIYDRVGEILLLLSEVACGEYRSMETALPEDNPIGALIRGVNEAVAALATGDARNRQYVRELEDTLGVIERQQAAIRELATPIIEVWDGVLCLPIVGVLDTWRSLELTQAVLNAVVDKRARCVIVDITGIGVMDTRTVDQLIRMAKAVALMDAQCFVTGISPIVAQTLDQMGIDLSSIAVRRNLRDALQEHVRRRRQTHLALPRPALAPTPAPTPKRAGGTEAS
jgi:rsbT co-antagonist protein RsbR